MDVLIESYKITPKRALFQRLNDYFDHIYLITLKRSIERHDLIHEILDGLDYEIFWGVDGSTLDLSEMGEYGLYDAELAKKKIPIGRELKRGEIGCALSHNNIYKDILKKGYRHALILEDDVIVDYQNVEYLAKSLQELPPEWDLLYLGYLYNNDQLNFSAKFRIHFLYPILNLIGFKSYNAKKLRCKYPRSYSAHLEKSGFHYGTHAYAVTASGAKKILTNQTPVSMAPDNSIGQMCMQEDLKAFRMKKRIFHQNRKNLESTISTK